MWTFILLVAMIGFPRHLKSLLGIINLITNSAIKFPHLALRNVFPSYLLVTCYILNFIPFILVMRFIHEPLARTLRATSIPRNDLNKLID